MQTYMANPDKIERKWYVVDAEGCTLGRLASGVASVLRGKNKPQFTPHVDTGDYVIVVNADELFHVLQKLLRKDPIKSRAIDITPLHILEMTRKKVRRPVIEDIREIAKK